MSIENRLTLLLASNPRAPWAPLIHEAAEEIVRLRSDAAETRRLAVRYAERSGTAQAALLLISTDCVSSPSEFARRTYKTLKEDHPDGSK